MKITYLGQAGLLFETDDLKIMIDPYLSNSVYKINPKNYRRQEVNEEFLKIKPDIMIFTHNHLDHYDPETVPYFVNDKSKVLVLSPTSVFNEVRKIGGDNNYVSFNRGTVWTEKGVTFRAVKAEHSDSCAIGVIIEYNNKKYYITGDTLYNQEIFKDIPNDIYAVFLPVNGVGNNMNLIDANAFLNKIKPNFAVPVHVGMFDDIDAIALQYENKIIPEIFKEVKLK